MNTEITPLQFFSSLIKREHITGGVFKDKIVPYLSDKKFEGKAILYSEAIPCEAFANVLQEFCENTDKETWSVFKVETPTGIIALHLDFDFRNNKFRLSSYEKVYDYDWLKHQILLPKRLAL